MMPEYLQYYGYSDFERRRTGNVKLVDPHIHTPYSDGALQPELVVAKAIRSGLDAVAITDHDELKGAKIAKRLAPEGIEVIVGEEVTTANGHVLALYLEEFIPPGEPVAKTIQRIHEQGGLAIAAHPQLRFGQSLSYKTISNVMRSPQPDVYWDGLEVFNFNANRRSNGKARTVYDAYKYHPKIGTPIGSSDAHGMLIGNGITAFDGTTFKDAVKERKTAALYTKRSWRENADEAVIFAINVTIWQTRIWRGLPVYP